MKLFLCEKSLEDNMDHPSEYIAEKGMLEPGPRRYVTTRKT